MNIVEEISGGQQPMWIFDLAYSDGNVSRPLLQQPLEMEWESILSIRETSSRGDSGNLAD
jgi:hypothetical protein